MIATPRFQSFPLNAGGTDYAVGDIHGCFSRLQDKLGSIGFDQEKDRLFSVGDLVDRGPESHLADEWVAKPWFHAVTGNHDDMAKRWPNGRMDSGNYKANGGAWNIASPKEQQLATAAAFAALPLALEIATAGGLVGIVHADCPYDTWSELRAKLLDPGLSNNKLGDIEGAVMWDRSRINALDDSGIPDLHALIVGHTPVQKAVALGNVFYIDTGAVFGRDFTVLNLHTLRPA